MSNPTIAALFQSPYHMQALADADAIGQEGAPGAGPFLLLYLKVEGQIIREASFETYGCPSAIAAGSWLTRWIEGRTLDEVQVIEPEDLSIVLGGLPLGKEHCASLAVGALRHALKQMKTGANVKNDPSQAA